MHFIKLTLALSKKEIQERYNNSFLGVLWAVINPLAMLAVFTFVFSKIFNVKFGGSTTSEVNFALALFLGLMMFNFFAECMSRATALITSHANIVKKISFPLETLALSTVAASYIHLLISFLVWLFAYFVFVGFPHKSAIFFPLIFAPLFILTYAFTLTLSAITVFFRDTSQLVSILLPATMFLSPIFFPVDAFPTDWVTLLYVNPLTVIIEEARSCFFYGREPNFVRLFIYSVVSISFLILGQWIFSKLKKGFADVI